jgi:hypothetical protein
MNDASNYIRVLQNRSGKLVACLEEIGLINGWLEKSKIDFKTASSSYNLYLKKIISDKND